MKRHIPNFITCLNLFSGCVGIVFAFKGQLEYAGYAILLSAAFDFFDGMVARWLRTYSLIGKELDSLADVVSFGVLPAAILYKLFLQAPSVFAVDWLPYSAFLIAVFSALRLAKFNIDTRQSENFIGLPTPACALFIMSLPFIDGVAALALQNAIVLLIITLLLCFLLIAELPLLSLKFKDLSFANNRNRYTLIILGGILILFLNFAAIPLILIIYIVLSLLQFKTNHEVYRRD